MMFNLNEDNQSIDDLIKYIESKLIDVKKNKNLDKEILVNIQNIYLSVISDWMRENYLLGIEVTPNIEKEISNDLLDLINTLNKL